MNPRFNIFRIKLFFLRHLDKPLERPWQPFRQAIYKFNPLLTKNVAKIITCARIIGNMVNIQIILRQPIRGYLTLMRYLNVTGGWPRTFILEVSLSPAKQYLRHHPVAIIDIFVAFQLAIGFNPHGKIGEMHW